MSENKNSEMNVLKLVKKQVSVQDGKVIESNEYVQNFEVDAEKVYCFLLSGSLCTDKEISGAFIDVVDSMIGRKKDPRLVGSRGDVEVLSVQYNEGGEFNYRQIDEFSDVLMQFVTKDGKRVNINEAVKGMNKVSFFTFCRGSKVLNRVGDDFCSKLEKVGYSANEINSIINGTLSVSYAPESINHVFPDVRFHSFSDKLFGQRYRFDYNAITGQSSKSLNGIDVVYCCAPNDVSKITTIKQTSANEKNDDKVEIKKYKRADFSEGFVKSWDEASVCVYTSKAINDIWRDVNDHHLGRFGRDEDWNIQGFRIKGLFKEHVKHSPVADYFSLAMANVLARNIALGFEVVKNNTLPDRPSLKDITCDLTDLKTLYPEKSYCAKGM